MESFRNYMYGFKQFEAKNIHNIRNNIINFKSNIKSTKILNYERYFTYSL